MSKHTPGPWKKCIAGGVTEVRCDAPVPVVSWAGFDDANRSLDEHRANARLIAAAPDLLEACKACLDMFADGGDPRKVIKALDAAIALAEGGAS